MTTWDCWLPSGANAQIIAASSLAVAIGVAAMFAGRPGATHEVAVIPSQLPAVAPAMPAPQRVVRQRRTDRLEVARSRVERKSDRLLESTAAQVLFTPDISEALVLGMPQEFAPWLDKAVGLGPASTVDNFSATVGSHAVARSASRALKGTMSRAANLQGGAADAARDVAGAAGKAAGHLGRL
jgi:hypothetical protein